jgi:hypothetical protein
MSVRYYICPSRMKSNIRLENAAGGRARYSVLFCSVLFHRHGYRDYLIHNANYGPAWQETNMRYNLTTAQSP